MKDDYYKPPYVYYSLDSQPTTLKPGTCWVFFTKTGRIKVRVAEEQTVPARTKTKKFAKVKVEVVE